MADLIDFRHEHVKRQPVHYSVHISHAHEGMSASLEGIDPTAKSLLAVAEDLEFLAKRCREDAALSETERGRG